MTTPEILWNLAVASIPLLAFVALVVGIQSAIDRRARWEDEHLHGKPTDE